MCRVTVGETAADEALQRLQQELAQLQLQQADVCSIPDFRGIPGCKGSGPRLFCGHVPKEATEDLVRAHFSRWGTVTDVYFPRHKKTLKRRPFCFVTFASSEAAERALAESPLNICGIPIKNLTMVEDRDAYYRTKHANTRAALLQALQSIGGAANGQVGPDQLNNLAALLAMEGVTAEAVVALLPQANGGGTPGAYGGGLQMDGLLGGAGRMPEPPSMHGAGLYGDYRLPQAPQPSRYAPPQASYGLPPLEQQLQQFNAAQQAMLAQQRMAAMPAQRAPAPPISAALLQQYGGGLGMGGMQQYGALQPQYGAPPPAPQLFPAQHQQPPVSGGWGGLAGQQPTAMRAPAAPLLGSGPASSATGSHGSGSGSPLECAAPQISLDEALAALSKLKAAQQQGPMADLPRQAAPPSYEILAGLGSTSTFSSHSPTLSGSPNLGTSPPSASDQGSLLASLDLPAAATAGFWAAASGK